MLSDVQYRTSDMTPHSKYFVMTPKRKLLQLEAPPRTLFHANLTLSRWPRAPRCLVVSVPT